MSWLFSSIFMINQINPIKRSLTATLHIQGPWIWRSGRRRIAAGRMSAMALRGVSRLSASTTMARCGRDTGPMEMAELEIQGLKLRARDIRTAQDIPFCRVDFFALNPIHRLDQRFQKLSTCRWRRSGRHWHAMIFIRKTSGSTFWKSRLGGFCSGLKSQRTCRVHALEGLSEKLFRQKNPSPLVLFKTLSPKQS